MRLLLVGDLVLDEPDAPFFFDQVRATLQAADLVVGHVETPHTQRGRESVGDVPAPASPPENIAALGQAGFGVATLAGNYIHDRGGEGIEAPSPCWGTPQLRHLRPGGCADAGDRAAGGLKVGVLAWLRRPARGLGGRCHPGLRLREGHHPHETQGANLGGPPRSTPSAILIRSGHAGRRRAAPRRVDVVVAAFHRAWSHPASPCMSARWPWAVEAR